MASGLYYAPLTRYPCVLVCFRKGADPQLQVRGDEGGHNTVLHVMSA